MGDNRAHISSQEEEDMEIGSTREFSCALWRHAQHYSLVSVLILRLKESISDHLIFILSNVCLWCSTRPKSTITSFIMGIAIFTCQWYIHASCASALLFEKEIGKQPQVVQNVFPKKNYFLVLQWEKCKWIANSNSFSVIFTVFTPLNG